MRYTAVLVQKLSTSFPRSNGLSHHLGGAFKAIDNAPERSIHVKVHPRPRSLGESRQILHELQKFGEIEVYRHLKYDFEAPAPNSLIVVYKDEASAARAREQNKILFQYATPEPSTQSPGNVSAVSEMIAQDEIMEELRPDRHNSPCSRPGELVIRTSTLQHLSHIQRQYYYWPVDVLGVGNPGASMFGRLPPGMHGLRDFDVTKREASVRKRDGMSHVWDEKIKTQGWETLTELWELGRNDRVTREMQQNINDGVD